MICEKALGLTCLRPGKRQDAACCRDVAYNALRCKRGRDMAARAVERASCMSGAFLSPAAEAIARQQDPTCPFCAREVGSTDHILWLRPRKIFLPPLQLGVKF